MLKNRKGFTLIELLIVVVIIGILAAIAIPKFSATREKAYFSAMKADLRNLQSQQEIFYQGVDAAGTPPAVRYTYTVNKADADLAFSESQGVTVTITAATGTEGIKGGFSATATHSAFNDVATRSCSVYVGTATPPAGTNTGVVTCVGEK